MQKKKKRMYDGGKSVLHVKNSAGGFYKVKKTGRLGKNCVHFSGRGICSKYDKWCSSANCPGYEKKKIEAWRYEIVAYHATSSVSFIDIM